MTCNSFYCRVCAHVHTDAYTRGKLCYKFNEWARQDVYWDYFLQLRAVGVYRQFPLRKAWFSLAMILSLGVILFLLLRWSYCSPFPLWRYKSHFQAFINKFHDVPLSGKARYISTKLKSRRESCSVTLILLDVGVIHFTTITCRARKVSLARELSYTYERPIAYERS